VRGFAVALASLSILLAAQDLDRSHAATGTARGGAGNGAQASIIGGTPGSIDSYPWLAYVAYQGSVEEFSCGGTVVAPRLILTAAHCALTGTGRLGAASKFAVVTGVGDLRNAVPEQVSSVSRVLVFPGFNPSRILNDAALLVLTAPVSAPPLALAGAGDGGLLAGGTPVAVAGWGLTDFRLQSLPALFRQGESVIRDNAGCARSLRRVLPTYAPAGQICVRSRSGAGPGLCNGDSGGPAVASRADGTQVQIGIVSLKGSFECDPRSAQVLARVDRVSPWVAEWTAAIEAGAPAPAVVVPEIRPPAVTRRDAEAIAWLGLEADLGNRLTRGKGHRIGCRRINREKVKCGVFWLKGRDFYEGTITVFASLPREGFVYNYRYTIRRYGVRCLISGRSARACRSRVFKR
jgi:hypothetical protein